MNSNNIIWRDHSTPVSVHFDDVYFNDDGAIAETMYVFIEGNNLNERFLAHTQSVFTIGETGFGSGLNFLIVWQQFIQFRQQYPNHILKKLQFVSCEKYPLTLNELKKIHETILRDTHLSNLAKQLQSSWPNAKTLFSDASLTILFGDINQFANTLSSLNMIIDAWFFDGFSPPKNAEMWSSELFSALFSITATLGTFATFTAAGQVKRNLINAGFTVKKRTGYGKKREMLIGYKNNLE